MIDTALLYPTSSVKYKSSLKFLAQRHLKKSIQNDASGHSSVEDAQTALELVYNKARELKSLVPKKPVSEHTTHQTHQQT